MDKALTNSAEMINVAGGISTSKHHGEPTFMDTFTLAQRPTALVIDDEHAVRWVVRQSLEPDICNVIEAADGISGIRRVSRANPPVDLVIVDLKLANLNGLEVIESLSRTHPHLPLLCITGFGATATDLLESTLRDYRVPVLLKPFSRHELAQAVQALLERASRRSAHAMS